MQTSTIVVLACLVAVVVAQAHAQPVDVAQESLLVDTPAHDRSPRNKRGLLLLKKKLLLGALGLGAAKVGAVGAGVAALAFKAKAAKPKFHGHTFFHHGPSPSLAVEVHRDVPVYYKH